ncbi:MAG: IgGFc-binding protein, partial [Myxococcota bacterium]|nr:IgGFc-binding protein [Myxococcota bacterium]
ASVGCTFWTVDLPNYPDMTLNPTPEDLPHGVVISNPGEKDATVSFEPPPGVVVDNPDPVVPAQQSRVFLMPVLNIKATGVSHGGIRIVSSRPVLAHQFNPWDNQFSNDASMLIPEPYLGSNYVVLTWPTTPLGLLSPENCTDADGDGACDCEDGECGAFDPIFCPSDCGDTGGLPGLGDIESQHGYFSVLAPYDDTTVTIQVTASILASDKVQATGPMGGLQQVVLQAGEVLNIEADPGGLGENGDLSGSTVSADKPVAVFAGHEEAAFGEVDTPGAGADSGACCADHLEEQLFPISMLGASYFAVKSKPRGSEPDVWRVQAAEAGVTISTTPSISGLDGVTLDKKGDWVEAHTADSFL